MKDNLGLFREEAILSLRETRDGEIPYSLPLSWSAINYCLVAIFIIFFLILTFTKISQKESVSGLIRPQVGEFKIQPTNKGIVKELHVSEGQMVRKGQILATISPNLSIQEDSESDLQIMKGIKNQIQSAHKQIAMLDSEYEAKQKKIEIQISSIKEKLKISKVRESYGIAQRDIYKDKYSSYISAKKNIVSKSELQQLESDILDIEKDVLEEASAQSDLKYLLFELDYEAKNMPISKYKERKAINSELSRLRLEEAKYKGSKSYTLNSPIDGSVTFLQSFAGESVDITHPIMTIAPVTTTLEVIVFIPPKAIGFVKEGQEVRMLLDAYPYQRYGAIKGKLKSISKSILAAADINFPILLNSPMYMGVISIEQKNDDFTKDKALKAGMTLTADISYGQSSALAWLIGPLTSTLDRL